MEEKNYVLIETQQFVNDMDYSDREQISDGYHSFKDLYSIRKAYNVALFNEWSKLGKYEVHKSRRHHDGEYCFDGGYFIVCAILPEGQITNHYRLEDWDYSYYKYHLFIGLRLHTSYHKISTLEEVKNRVLKNYKTDGYYNLITSVAALKHSVDKFMTRNKVKDYILEEEVVFKHKGEISSNIRNLKEMLNKIE